MVPSRCQEAPAMQLPSTDPETLVAERWQDLPPPTVQRARAVNAGVSPTQVKTPEPRLRLVLCYGGLDTPWRESGRDLHGPVRVPDGAIGGGALTCLWPKGPRPAEPEAPDGAWGIPPRGLALCGHRREPSASSGGHRDGRSRADRDGPAALTVSRGLRQRGADGGHALALPAPCWRCRRGGSRRGACPRPECRGAAGGGGPRAASARQRRPG